MSSDPNRDTAGARHQASQLTDENAQLRRDLSSISWEMSASFVIPALVSQLSCTFSNPPSWLPACYYTHRLLMAGVICRSHDGRNAGALL